MFEKLESIENRYEELNNLMAQPEIATDFERLKVLGQERSSIEDLVMKYREYKVNLKNLEETRSMLDESSDDEMHTFIRDEVELLKSKNHHLLDDIKNALLPKDPSDSKNVIMEIRAGTGGDEAALFAADLFRTYSRYAQLKGWSIEIISSSDSSKGGFKEVISEIKGKGAYSRLKYESGVHRVQRVPVTEAGGRIHTSTATVAVLPEAEEVEIDIDPDDLRIDTYRSSGAGGQHVNKTSSAIRITHIPTGIVTTCQDERSQHKNKSKAMAVLRARLLRLEQQKQEDQLSSQRRSQVGSAERSEKIRTYNYPQDRLSDHRIGLNLHNLPVIMEGNLDELIDAVSTAEQARLLEESLL